MPRGRKKKEDITLEQQLENIATEIANKEAELKELKTNQKELKKQLEQEEMQKLLATVKENVFLSRKQLTCLAQRRQKKITRSNI